MIHEAFNKAEIAFIYYKKAHPKRKYNRDQARKQFIQDTNLNVKILEAIFNRIISQQQELLKKAA